ncbi:hypothetical protein GUITHDRAFT_140160 [Guillardia theta CCMP2712]|uniref:Uncharacterized protein n=1 Tax=Guillardia theta (strain CCMP2712) TaxID=905079 RepID=L1J6A2_GUITC|nr:hypothetical protein GUITHDRAFT_140160 [Guillardia theta CCMP2712]EKX44046.1 hypothetical protein GUITHDRAFT_140160 [Guillardia theta CCMP2712]|eukprot:XP_005831026.1 hypothetical protein GUITHDRAFT_140160 [Guillardia theta CCMP2712]
MAKVLSLFVLMMAAIAMCEGRRGHGDRGTHEDFAKDKKSHGCNHGWSSGWGKGWDCCGGAWGSRQSGCGTGWSFFDGMGLDGNVIRHATDKVRELKSSMKHMVESMHTVDITPLCPHLKKKNDELEELLHDCELKVSKNRLKEESKREETEQSCRRRINELEEKVERAKDRGHNKKDRLRDALSENKILRARLDACSEQMVDFTAKLRDAESRLMAANELLRKAKGGGAIQSVPDNEVEQTLSSKPVLVDVKIARVSSEGLTPDEPPSENAAPSDIGQVKTMSNVKESMLDVWLLLVCLILSGVFCSMPSEHEEQPAIACEREGQERDGEQDEAKEEGQAVDQDEDKQEEEELSEKRHERRESGPTNDEEADDLDADDDPEDFARSSLVEPKPSAVTGERRDAEGDDILQSDGAARRGSCADEPEHVEMVAQEGQGQVQHDGEESIAAGEWQAGEGEKAREGGRASTGEQGGAKEEGDQQKSTDLANGEQNSDGQTTKGGDDFGKGAGAEAEANSFREVEDFSARHDVMTGGRER